MTRDEPDWLDEDGYPTEAAEQRIREWDIQDINGCLDFVKSLWKWPAEDMHRLRPEEVAVVGVKEGERYLRLATGGWSGNESLIRAMREGWARIAWRMSASGGLHIYRYMRVGE